MCWCFMISGSLGCLNILMATGRPLIPRPAGGDLPKGSLSEGVRRAEVFPQGRGSINRTAIQHNNSLVLDTFHMNSPAAEEPLLDEWGETNEQRGTEQARKEGSSSWAECLSHMGPNVATSMRMMDEWEMRREQRRAVSA